jgi:hypothetical protein
MQQSNPIEQIRRKLESAAPNVTQILVSRSELEAAIAELAAAQQRAARLERAYPEWSDDLDETGCPTGGVHCLICDGGGHKDGRKKMPPTHRPGCLRVTALADGGTAAATTPFCDPWRVRVFHQYGSDTEAAHEDSIAGLSGDFNEDLINSLLKNLAEDSPVPINAPTGDYVFEVIYSDPTGAYWDTTEWEWRQVGFEPLADGGEKEKGI